MVTTMVQLVPAPMPPPDQVVESLVALREQFSLANIIDLSSEQIEDLLKEAYEAAAEKGVLRRINYCIEQPDNFDKDNKVFRLTRTFGIQEIIGVYDPQQGTTQVLVDGAIALDNSSMRRPVLVIGDGNWLRALGQYFHDLERQRAGARAEEEHKAQIAAERRRLEMIHLATRKI